MFIFNAPLKAGRCLRTHDCSGGFHFSRGAFMAAAPASTGGTFVNCLWFTKPYIGRPISTPSLCMRYSFFTRAGARELLPARAHAVREPISRQAYGETPFHRIPSHFQLEMPKWIFLWPVSKHFPSIRPSFPGCRLYPSLARSSVLSQTPS